LSRRCFAAPSEVGEEISSPWILVRKYSAPLLSRESVAFVVVEKMVFKWRRVVGAKLSICLERDAVDGLPPPARRIRVGEIVTVCGGEAVERVGGGALGVLVVAEGAGRYGRVGGCWARCEG
jgi:hypothetical protein